MTIKLANNAVSRLAAPLTTSATSLSVMAGEGARFPSLAAGETFPITVVNANGALEIMRCTARSSDVFTVVRGQENTTPQTFAVGDRVELRLTAGAVDEKIQQEIEGKADKSANLSDLTNAATARTNLGLGNNATGRSNLGLGNSATRNVGTSSNTVAAGDDSRITGAAQKSANLSDLTNAETARSNLGLGSAATRYVGTGANEVPANSNLGSAATRDVGAGPDQVPTNSDLGTAATHDVTTGNIDTAAGRVLKVGDFGIGSSTPIAGYNVIENASGFYSFAGPEYDEAPYSSYINVGYHFEGYGFQIFMKNMGGSTAVGNDLLVRRNGKGTWGPFETIYHSGNLSKSVKYWSGTVESGGIGTANNPPGTVDFSGNTVLTGLRTAGAGNWYSIYARGRTLTL